MTDYARVLQGVRVPLRLQAVPNFCMLITGMTDSCNKQKVCNNNQSVLPNAARNQKDIIKRKVLKRILPSMISLYLTLLTCIKMEAKNKN